MVLVMTKITTQNYFQLDASPNLRIDSLLQLILQCISYLAVNQQRILLFRLASFIHDLATYGVLKPQQLQGLSFQDILKNPKQIQTLSLQKIAYAYEPKGPHVKDPNNQRYGVLPLQHECQKLKEVSNRIKQDLKSLTLITTEQWLFDQIEQLRDLIMLTYPAYEGLPQWQPVVMILQNKVPVQDLATEQMQYFQPGSILWWAGKTLDPSENLRFYIGKNEKSKIIVKLQHLGGEMPARQPPLDNRAYKELVKYYHKKTKQAKELEQNQLQQQYMQPLWAQKSLKSQLIGTDKLKFKP